MKFDNEFNEVKIRHVIAIFLLAIIILIPIVVFMSFKSDGEISSSNMDILSLLLSVVVLSMLLKELKLSKEKIINLYNDFKNKINIREITHVIIFFTCLNVGGANIILDIIYSISPRLADAFIKNSGLTINSISDYFICFLILVIVSPVIDEIIFRNIVFKRLSKKFNVYVGVIVSSIIFSALNIQPEVIGFFALGIINCIFYVKYENILIPILIYSISNFINMLTPMFYSEISYKTITMTFNEMIINLIFGIILFIIGTIFFIKFICKNKIYLRESLN